MRREIHFFALEHKGIADNTEMGRKDLTFLSCSFFRKMCQLLHGKYHYNDVVVILTVNTLRTGSFKLFKRPFPGFL